VSQEIIQGAVQTSAVMRLARRLPNMSRAQRRIPVLSAFPTAYFVSGDTGLKQTTEMAWSNKYIDAEELAVIVPISENVLADVDYDIWGEVKPRIIEALGLAIDQAVLFGTNAPASWPDDILTGATAASSTVDYSTQVAASKDLYDMILGTVNGGGPGLVGLVEEDGFEVNGFVGSIAMRARLRGARLPDGGGNAGKGEPLFKREPMQDGTRWSLDGNPIYFPLNSAIADASAYLFAGDWTQLVYAIRTDITWKLATEGVIQDGSGATVYNLFQQDMVALRATMRLGWQLPNPINRVQATEASRYPFSVLVP
jgi:hypothetical protein